MFCFRIDIFDLDSKRLESLSVSHRDVDRIQEQAGHEPASPLLARWIEDLLDQAGFRPDGGAQVLEAARLMLGREANAFQLRARRKVGPLKGGQQPEPESPVRVETCEDPTREAVRLARELAAQGRVPVFWNMRHGLRFELSPAADIDRHDAPPVLTGLTDLLSFILRAPNRRLAYILEDYGDALDAADQATGRRIERLMDDVRAALANRDEKVVALQKLVPPAPAFTPPPAGQHVPQATPAGQDDAPQGSLLDRYSVNLSDPRRLDRTKPVVAMDAHIMRAAQIICQLETNNPLLVGRPGVGKTTVAEGLARLIASPACPARLSGRSLYSLSLAGLIAGTRYRGDLEDRVEALLKEVNDNKDRIIVFIDEMHTLVNAGATEGGLGLSETFKPALARGDFPCMGATTQEGAALIEADPALARRFKKIAIAEPDRDTAVSILAGIVGSFERHHGVAVAYSALEAAVDLSIARIPNECLPGKAVSLLDGACAYRGMFGLGNVTSADIEDELKRIINFTS